MPTSNKNNNKKHISAVVLQIPHRQIRQQRTKTVWQPYWKTAGKGGEIYEEIHGLSTNTGNVSAHNPQMFKDSHRIYALVGTNLGSFEGQIP